MPSFLKRHDNKRAFPTGGSRPSIKDFDAARADNHSRMGLSSKVKQVTLIPMIHFQWGRETPVFMIQGHEHPDPSKRMYFTEDAEGHIISDFKKAFRRNGRPVTLSYEVPPLSTANQEMALAMKAARGYFRAR